MKIVPRSCAGAVASLLLLTRVAVAEPSLLEVQKIRAGKKFVDLTHAFAPGIPDWHGFPDEKRETAYWYEKGKGSIGDAMENKDAKGLSHYPGWSMPALKYLFEERKITASGHETTDTDPGIAASKDDATLETCILSTNHYQIELLANLDQVPESGALVVVSFPKPKGGSGFPARVFAICPP
jgi:kynurenine formamidase